MMKKKVLYGVFMALFAVLSMGTLQSCKDDLSDLEKKVNASNAELLDMIQKLQDQANQCQQNCQTEIAALKARVAANEGSIAELSGAIKNLVTLEKLQQDLDALKAALQQDSQAKIDAAIATVNSRIDNLDSDYKAKFSKLEADYDDLFGKYAEVAVKLNTQDSVVNAVQTELAAIKASNQANTDSINSFLQKFNDLSLELNNVENSLGELWVGVFGEGGLQEQMSMIYNALLNDVDGVRTELQDQLAQINESIAALEEKYDSLTFRLNSLITGIIIQGTHNPIFGDFRLPIGVQSNMLFNWYGLNQGLDFNFPTSSVENAYDGEVVLTAEDLAFLGVAKENIPNGYFMGDVSLGKVFLTINPVGNNFDATNFTLETSAGKALPFGLSVAPSDQELFHGYTRGVENGFYEADVVMPGNAEAINATKIVIEEGLKEAVKDILKDRTRRNALNLLKALYDQMQGMLPAYGVRYDKFYMDRSSYSILSKYDLAVATAQPLSYKFLYGKSTSHRLRTFGHIQNLFADLIDKDKFKFELNTDFTIDKFKINFEDLTFEFSINPKVELTDNIVVTVDTKPQDVEVELTDEENGNTVSGTVTIPGQTVDAVITPSDLQPLVEAITEAFQKAIGEMSVDLGKQINDQIRDKLIAGIQDQVNNMLGDIQSQINKMLTDLQDQINGQISDMIDDVMTSIEDKFDPVFDRVNKIIDIYNKVANKINHFLADPNNYLQPAIFYKNNGGVGVLSNVKSDPTILVKAGGNAFSFYLSSYTAEVVAPAAKKFVAVTNVYDESGNSVLAANSADVKAMNANSVNFNKVLDGSTIRVAVATSNMKKGLTYEIVYQGLDYTGVTSTQKFYIKVK